MFKVDRKPVIDFLERTLSLQKETLNTQFFDTNVDTDRGEGVRK